MSNYQNGDFETKYGVITVRNPGRVNEPPNLQTYAQTAARHVQLQGPALRAFKAAELRITPARLKRKGKVRHILITGSGYRSYQLQKSLYEGSDNIDGRYADPDGSLHVEALAVDVDSGQSVFRRAQIRKALVAEGWHYGVSGEPWHASFHVTG
jgi:hypothetical protein